jgi:hypothetical protein
VRDVQVRHPLKRILLRVPLCCSDRVLQRQRTGTHRNTLVM